MEPDHKSLLYLGVGAAAGALTAAWLLGRRSGGDGGRRTERKEGGRGEKEAEVCEEQLSRTRALYGEEGMNHIQKGFVVVVGLGGVGSHAATALARSGVGKIRIIDYDQVSLSSLNRHASATREEVGESKATTLKDYFKRIFPFCEVEVMRSVFSAENAEELLKGSPDYVIDAIDNRLTKAQLIHYCQTHDLPVISCMGAGGRVDPSRIQVSRLTQTRNDPLCRIMRLVLKKMNVRLNEVMVVYSSEKPPGKLMDLTDDVADNPDEYQLLPNFRVRIMPVLGTIPAMFGLVAATFVLNALSQNTYEDMLPIKTSVKMANKMMCTMYINEEKLYKVDRRKRQLTLEDVEYIISDVFGGRCFLTGAVDNLALRRFNREKPVATDNIILLTEAQAKKHDKGEINFSPEQVAKLQLLLQKHFLDPSIKL